MLYFGVIWKFLSSLSVLSNQLFFLLVDVIRAVLPNIIPPSYRGATIRYLYYIKTMLSGQWQILETGHSQRELAKDLAELVCILIHSSYLLFDIMLSKRLLNNLVILFVI